MATRGTIPAKRAGGRSTKKKGAAKAPKRAATVEVSAGRELTYRAEPRSPQEVVDRLVQLALQHAHGSTQPSYVIPIGRDGVLYLAFGSAHGIRELLERVSPAPKRRLVRDAVTGMFASAIAALRRPKTTTREIR